MENSKPRSKSDKVVGAKVTLGDYGIIAQRAFEQNMTISQYIKFMLFQDPKKYDRGGEILDLNNELEQKYNELKNRYSNLEQGYNEIKNRYNELEQKYLRSNKLRSECANEIVKMTDKNIMERRELEDKLTAFKTALKTTQKALDECEKKKKSNKK